MQCVTDGHVGIPPYFPCCRIVKDQPPPLSEQHCAIGPNVKIYHFAGIRCYHHTTGMCSIRWSNRALLVMLCFPF